MDNYRQLILGMHQMCWYGEPFDIIKKYIIAICITFNMFTKILKPYYQDTLLDCSLLLPQLHGYEL